MRPLPEVFCWTRFGTEAGQTVQQILRRKERERRESGGIFLWGIGNSVGPAIAELVKRCDVPEVLFSPILSRPRAVDVEPSAVVAWTSGETLTGAPYLLPPGAYVTSRGPVREGAAHYALVCAQDEPLEVRDLGSLELHGLRNLLSGRGMGASQVTAVVSRPSADTRDGPYRIAMRARLVEPYFIRLRRPAAIDADTLEALG